MKKIACAILAASVLLLGSALPSYAAGHGSRGNRGGHGHGSGVFFGTRIFVGPGFWGPWWYGGGYPYYPYPYYSYPYYAAPPLAVQQEPPVYLQQPESQPPQPNYWYYCQNPQGYYPYVQQCPGGWMTVVPPTTAPAR